MCAERQEEVAKQATVQFLDEAKRKGNRMKFEQIARATPTTISVAFLIPGALTLVFSVTANSQVLAFIGLGLTFWGALFLFIRPTRYVQSAILNSTASSTYTNIDRIIKDMKLEGKTCYVPPYPKDVYLPEHLKGLKDMVMFISMDPTADAPSIEELAKRKFLLENPKGICITPPGAGLFAQFETELKRDLTKLQINELCESLTQLITENLQMAKEAEFTIEEKHVQLRLIDSTYKNLYNHETIKCVNLIGCPLVSAVACAIAKTTGKTVNIKKIITTPDGETVVATYEM
jgi:hypothetical protein